MAEMDNYTAIRIRRDLMAKILRLSKSEGRSAVKQMEKILEEKLASL